MARAWASCALLLVLAACGGNDQGGDAATPSLGAGAQPLRSADWLGLLPDGEEKRRFILDCTNCHVFDEGIAFSGGAPRSRAEWVAAVDRMLSYAGAHTDFPVMTVGREASATADWLVANVTGRPVAGPDVPMPAGAQVDEFLLPDSAELPHDVAVLQDGRILVTGMATHQMWILDPRTGAWTTAPIPVANANPRAVDVRAGQASGAPDWWVLLGNPHRVARRDGATGEWRTYPIGFYGHSIVEDSTGRVWFNSHFTRSPGVIGYVDPVSDGVVTFDIPTPDTLARGGTPIPYGLRVAPDGSVWGTELRGNRIVRLDPETGAVRSFGMPVPESGPRRPDFDREGRLWIPEYAGNALTMFDPASETFTRYELPVSDAAPYVVRIDHRREVAWVGTGTADVAFAFDLNDREFEAYPLPSTGALVRHTDVDEATGEAWLAYGGAPGIPARIARVRPGGSQRVAVAEALVGFLRGDVALDTRLLDDTVTLHVAPEGGGQSRSVPRAALRDRDAWTVGRVAMAPPSEALTELTTRPGRYLNCMEGSLSDRYPEMEGRPHVGAMLRPEGGGSCLQSWNVTFVFAADGRPVVTDVLYDQWEW